MIDHTLLYQNILIQSITAVLYNQMDSLTLYISYPVINTTSTATNTGKFTGVVVASIKLEMLGNFLKNQIFRQFNSI